MAGRKRKRARQRTARYRAKQRKCTESQKKTDYLFRWGKRAKVSSRHSGKSGFVPLPDGVCAAALGKGG